MPRKRQLRTIPVFFFKNVTVRLIGHIGNGLAFDCRSSVLVEEFLFRFSEFLFGDFVFLSEKAHLRNRKNLFILVFDGVGNRRVKSRKNPSFVGKPYVELIRVDVNVDFVVRNGQIQQIVRILPRHKIGFVNDSYGVGYV